MDFGTPEKQFVAGKFREYYARHLEAPSEMGRREFGFGWEKKIDYRHKSFSSPQELQEFVLRETPLFISYSCAYYEFPAGRPMEKKNFLGADLVFDLDKAPATDHEHNEIICGICLEKIRGEAIRLVEEFLVKDFGFSKSEVGVAFSGSKGFHIHLQNKPVQELGQEARRQMLNYITATELDAGKILVKEKYGNAEVLRGPTRDAKGWGKKFFEKTKGVVEGTADAGLGKAMGEKIAENRGLLLKKIGEGNWDALRGLGRVWEQLLQETIEEGRVEVDKQVTLDTARLIRLPNSLHGDTGFVAKKISLSELGNFDAARDAVAFGSKTVSVKIASPCSFDLMGQEMELKEGKNEVPEAVAILLLCKKKALLA
jgi:DNA primase small subunit